MPGDKYLPGLEGDPSGAILENWTDEDWNAWLAEEVEGKRRLEALDSLEPDWKFSRTGSGGHDDEAFVFADHLQEFEPGGADQLIAMFMIGVDPLDPLARVKSLGAEGRAKFHRLWYKLEHGIDTDTGRSIEDARPKPKPNKWRNRVITGVAVVTVGVGGFLVTRGGGGSLEWSVTDPVGDIVASWEDIEPAENPDPATDITVMGVKNEGNDTTVSVRFNGAAREVSLGQRQDLSAGLLIVFPDGRVIDILWGSDRCKISDSSDEGDAIECKWVDESNLELKIEGWKPIPGTNVTFVTYVSEGIGGGSSSDTVELATD